MTIAAIIMRLFLSVILIRAALHKIRARKKFQAELQAYQLLPEFSLSATTWLLIFTELSCSVLLLDPTRSFPALITAILFCLYALAMAINLLKGRTNIDCGCTGPTGIKKTIAWSLVIRNVILAFLALLCSSVTSVQNTGALELFIIMAGAVVSLLLYEAIEQGISNAQGYQRWTH